MLVNEAILCKKSKGDFEGEGGGNWKKFIRPKRCALKFSKVNLESEFKNSQKWPSFIKKTDFPGGGATPRGKYMKMKS